MPSGSLDPHFGQAPGLHCRALDDRDSGRSQSGVFAAHIPYLDPDHHRVPGGAGRVPGNLEEPLAEEEHRPRMFRGAELTVDGQAQGVRSVAIEAAAAVQVTGSQEDPAAQNVHATIFSIIICCSCNSGVHSRVSQNDV